MVIKLTTSKTPKSKDYDFIIMSILKKVEKPITTRELQNEVQKGRSFCPSSSIVGLKLLRIARTQRNYTEYMNVYSLTL